MHSARCRQFSLAQSTETMLLGFVPFVLSETSALTPSIEQERAMNQEWRDDLARVRELVAKGARQSDEPNLHALEGDRAALVERVARLEEAQRKLEKWRDGCIVQLERSHEDMREGIEVRLQKSIEEQLWVLKKQMLLMS